MKRRRNGWKKRVGRARGRASQRVQAAARMERGVDAETLRWRARMDARGEVLREGRTYFRDGVMVWSVRRSVRGRVDQVDIVVDGAVWRTCGRRKLPVWLR